jgi:uncharacterized protein YjiS (DUF1127 family)
MTKHFNVSTVDIDFTIADDIMGLGHIARPIVRQRRTLASAIVRFWRLYLIRRSCRATAKFLGALDDRALAEIGLRRAEIPSAARQLEVALLRHYGTSSAIGDTP